MPGQIRDSPWERAPTLYGGTPAYDFAKISENLHEIEKSLGRGSATEYTCILEVNYYLNAHNVQLNLVSSAEQKVSLLIDEVLSVYIKIYKKIISPFLDT